ncbi:hypothetical protein SLE2022_260910 [Rubroshorea leprosula]
MDSKSSPVEMFFFPFVGGGHQLPLIDMARMFAARGANSTIITTPKHALSFQNSILRDQQSGRTISIHTLQLPEGVDIADTNMSAQIMTDTSILQEPLRNLLLQARPDCIIHDFAHRWVADAIDSLGIGIPRIIFSGSGCFAHCVQQNMFKFKPYEKVDSDYEPFVVPDLPDRIELTRSQLPMFVINGGGPKRKNLFNDGNFGSVVNSFYELESAYVEYMKELGDKAWLVGPVSLCNRDVADKAERGQKGSIDEQSILNWLNSKEPHSVLYISFGSVARLPPEQLLEIAYGLEASGHSFIWVVGKSFKSEGENEENWLPSGFEERIEESKKGIIIRGWAPQLLILEHGAVGGFLTHCGWNSTLEGVSAGVPMITWPLSAEQFSNEKLIVNLLKIGVKVGSMQWGQSWGTTPGEAVGREKVEAAVRRLMDEGDEAAEMRRKAKELAEKAKQAVEHGGSSYKNAEALIQELKTRRRPETSTQ